jgi:hypothetical protein
VSHTTVGLDQSQDFNEPTRPSLAEAVIENYSEPSRIDPPPRINQQNQLGSPFITPFSMDEWPQLDIWGPGLEFPSLPNGSRRLSTSAPESASKLSASFDSPESHSCPRGSYELFRDLICPAPFLHAPESNTDTVSAQLDQVLRFNRDAIDRLSRLLKCPCAKTGHRIMVHASIISRILIWYQQAVGWTSDNSGGVPSSTLAPSSPSGSASSSSSPPSEATSGTDTANSSIVQSTGFAVSQVPISVGTFAIEDQNFEAAIRNQLVLIELKKTANLIDRFASQDYGESSDHGLTSLYSHLGVWLRSEHSKTVGILRASLNALNETLES